MVGPVGTEGVRLTVMFLEITAPVPHVFVAETVTFPEIVPTVTTINVSVEANVLVPVAGVVITQSAGSVQL